MRHLLSPLLLLGSVALYAYDDMGIQGELYPIKEENIKTLVEKRISELDGGELKETYLRTIEKAFAPSFSLPASKKDSTATYIDKVAAASDVYDPNDPNKLLFRKGDYVVSSLPEDVVLHMCFIDAKHEDVTKKVIEEFGKCDYLVANRDIRTMTYLKGNRVFPMSEPYLNRFDIKHLPVKLTMQRDTITKQHLNVVRIMEELKEEGSE